MHRYLVRAPKREYPPGVRLVHNFYPGPHDDPGRDCEVGRNGFRIWITDEPSGSYGDEHRCYCGWLDGREHYGTRATSTSRAGSGSGANRSRAPE